MTILHIALIACRSKINDFFFTIPEYQSCHRQSITRIIQHKHRRVTIHQTHIFRNTRRRIFEITPMNTDMKERRRGRERGSDCRKQRSSSRGRNRSVNHRSKSGPSDKPLLQGPYSKKVPKSKNGESHRFCVSVDLKDANLKYLCSNMDRDLELQAVAKVTSNSLWVRSSDSGKVSILEKTQFLPLISSKLTVKRLLNESSPQLIQNEANISWALTESARKNQHISGVTGYSRTLILTRNSKKIHNHEIKISIFLVPKDSNPFMPSMDKAIYLGESLVPFDDSADWKQEFSVDIKGIDLDAVQVKSNWWTKRKDKILTGLSRRQKVSSEDSTTNVERVDGMLSLSVKVLSNDEIRQEKIKQKYWSAAYKERKRMIQQNASTNIKETVATVKAETALEPHPVTTSKEETDASDKCISNPQNHDRKGNIDLPSSMETCAPAQASVSEPIIFDERPANDYDKSNESRCKSYNANMLKDTGFTSEVGTHNSMENLKPPLVVWEREVIYKPTSSDGYKRHEIDESINTFDFLIDRLDEALVYLGLDQMIGLDDFSCSTIDTDSLGSYTTSASTNRSKENNLWDNFMSVCGLCDIHNEEVVRKEISDKLQNQKSGNLEKGESSSQTADLDEVDQTLNIPNEYSTEGPKEVYMKAEMDEISLISNDFDSLEPHNWKYNKEVTHLSA